MLVGKLALNWLNWSFKLLSRWTRSDFMLRWTWWSSREQIDKYIFSKVLQMPVPSYKYPQSPRRCSYQQLLPTLFKTLVPKWRKSKNAKFKGTWVKRVISDGNIFVRSVKVTRLETWPRLHFGQGWRVVTNGMWTLNVLGILVCLWTSLHGSLGKYVSTNALVKLCVCRTKSFVLSF